MLVPRRIFFVDFSWTPGGDVANKGFEGHIPKSAVGRYLPKVPFIDFLVAGGMTSVKEAEKGKVESTTDMHSATGVASAEFLCLRKVKIYGT